MLNPVGSSVAHGFAGINKPTAGLETQLSQYEVKLADWVNCPSCKTAEGKAKIKEISDKISEIKQRLEVADAAKQSRRPDAMDANTAVGNNRDKVGSASSVNDKVGDRSFPAAPQSTATVGTHLDVFA